MRVVIAWVVAVLAFGAVDASAQTVWNVKARAAAGGSTQLHVLDETPDVLFPNCRCVAGRWRIAARGGETATHFVGTLDRLSFNHAALRAGTLRVKVRKTRALMGAHRDYRERLMAVVRGEGALVVKAVSGGEWEVVAWADELVDLAEHAKWAAADDVKVAKAAAIVDPIASANELAKLINQYRASIGLPRVPISKQMTKVAQAHAHDLATSKIVTDRCDMHSWSDRGKWTPCCGDDSAKSAACMQRKAKEIAGYKGRSYEIAATAAGITPARALELWQKSPRHHAIVRNEGQWAQPWKAMGVAVEGDYAVAWFGNLP